MIMTGTAVGSETFANTIPSLHGTREGTEYRRAAWCVALSSGGGRWR
jgi:hypothetical protein